MASPIPTEKLPDELDLNKLGDVINALWELRHLWKEIGDNLVLTPGEIESIRLREQNDPNSCLREVLRMWLLRASKPNRPITWSALVLALKRNNVKSQSAIVIQEIMEKYEVVLPKEITQSSNRVATTGTKTGRKAANQGQTNVPGTKIKGDKEEKQVTEPTGQTNVPGTKIKGDKEEKQVTEPTEYSDIEDQLENVEEENNLINFCGNTNDELCCVEESSAPFASSAFANKSLIWVRRDELYVEFMNPSALQGTEFNTDNILDWANRWRDGEPCTESNKVIPRLVPRVKTTIPSDIRVLFAERDSKEIQESNSCVGVNAQDKADSYTMFLNLWGGGKDYKTHVVVHEFGHALGLLHEHQRPDIWNVVRKHLATGYGWYEDHDDYCSIDCDKQVYLKYSPEYDPQSVMHYPNFKQGLNWKTTDEIDNAKLPKSEADILKAIVSTNRHLFPKYPSEIDIGFLHNQYAEAADKEKLSIKPSVNLSGGKKKIARAPPEGETRFHEEDHGDIYDKLQDYADKWDNIGNSLGFFQRELEIIRAKPMLLQNAPQSWLRQMLSQWLQWAPNDRRGSNYFATKESLHAALLRSDLGQPAALFE